MTTQAVGRRTINNDKIHWNKFLLANFIHNTYELNFEFLNLLHIHQTYTALNLRLMYYYEYILEYRLDDGTPPLVANAVLDWHWTACSFIVYSCIVGTWSSWVNEKKRKNNNELILYLFEVLHFVVSSVLNYSVCRHLQIEEYIYSDFYLQID